MIDMNDCILTILVASNQISLVSSQADRAASWDLYFTVIHKRTNSLNFMKSSLVEDSASHLLKVFKNRYCMVWISGIDVCHVVQHICALPEQDRLVFNVHLA